jgi:type IV pilus assembly protein PilQ
MSKNHKRRLSAAVFFCLGGWVCNDLAIAADKAEQADPGRRDASVVGPAAAGATPAPAGNLFDSGKSADKPAEEIPAGQSVKAGAFGEIDLHVKDLDVSTVLQLLSIQAKRNIIASKDVGGTVTADLYGVDFYEALDAVLHANGFGYREKGKFIYIYTAKELAEIQKLEEKPITRIVRLNYLNAKDASTFVTPLLSGAGSIALSGEVPPSMQATITDAGRNTSAHQDTLLVKDLQGNVDAILAVIKELDIRPKQVSIKATVLQAQLSEANAFGVDITVLGGSTLDDFTTPLSVIDDLADGTVKPAKRTGAGSTTVGNAVNGPSNVRVGFIAGSVNAFIRALDEVTDTTVVANPELLVLNRQRADLLVGGRLGYISTQQNETSTTQTVEFLDIGTQLTVRPFVSDDGMVRLELRPSISTGTTSLQGGFVIPETEEQSLTTNVMVRSGQTVVIGGLFQETTQVQRSQVPGLGDVPILGTAFKGVDDSTDRSEVIFMVTPTIVKDEILYAQGDRALESVDYAVLGAREGLLPWSRTKQTSSYMQDALKYYKEGKTDLALMEANKALNLDSTIIDARRMKSAITGQRISPFHRSILRETTNHLIDAKLGTAAAPAPADPKNANAAVDEWDPSSSLEAAGVKPDWADNKEVAPASNTKPAAPATNANDAQVRPVNDPAVTPEVAPEVAPAIDPEAAPAPAKDQAPAPARAKDESTPAPAPAPSETEERQSKSSDEQPKDDEEARKAIEAVNNLFKNEPAPKNDGK